MITRFLSLATGIVTLDVYLRSQLSSNDPLFLFTSDSLAVNLAMLMLVGAVVAVSFRKQFNSWFSYALCSAAAVILITSGIAGFFLPAFTYSIWDIILPLNYMIMLESGAILGISALTYKHAARPQSLKIPESAMIANKLKLVFPAPKTSHSPNSSRTRRAQPA